MSEKLKFSPNILTHLGEELVPNLDQSIIELIRNSYDADSTTCTVELLNTDMFGGSIVVQDNGTGMDASDIRNGWLLIGSSNKESKKRTPIFKRVPVGDKGLGRLSALRLGTKVKLISRPRKEKGVEYSISIDWEEFDKVQAVEEIELNIVKRKTDKPQGTEIYISNLRNDIKRKEVNNLARSILLLTGPFRFEDSFKAELKVPEFSELEDKVRKAYFEDAVYKLEVKKEEAKKATFRVYDWKGEELWFGKAENEYNTVPVDFEFWVFKLDGTTFSTRQSTVSEVRNWLQECGGIYLFEGNMRVPPYGDAGYDWLDINLRRAQSPEERPSTNTSIGRVTVNNSNKKLQQKTDRFGYKENEAFLNLKELCHEGLEFMATKRLGAAEKRRAAEKEKRKKEKKKTEKDLDHALDKAFDKDNKRGEDKTSRTEKDREAVKKAVKEVLKAKEKEALSLKEDLQLYRSMATIGMTSAVFAHEIGKPLNNIELLLEDLGEEVKSKKSILFDETVDLITKSIRRLKKYIDLPLKLLKKNKRRSGRLNINQCIKNITNLFEPVLEDADITVELDMPSENKRFILGSEALIDGIFANLFSNSVSAFQRPNIIVEKRQISITTDVEDGYLLVCYRDNAGGITDIDIDEMWLPGKTSINNGTGLGLTIVKDSVSDLEGEVSAKEQCDIGGAEFLFKFPLV